MCHCDPDNCREKQSGVFVIKTRLPQSPLQLGDFAMTGESKIRPTDCVTIVKNHRHAGENRHPGPTRVPRACAGVNGKKRYEVSFKSLYTKVARPWTGRRPVSSWSPGLARGAPRRLFTTILDSGFRRNDGENRIVTQSVSRIFNLAGI